MIRSNYRTLRAFAELVRVSWMPVLVVLAIGYLIFLGTRDPVIPPGVTVDATPAKEVAKEATVPLQIAPPVQVYRPAVKKKLKLPQAVQTDAAKHVVASTRTPNDERSHTVTTVLDSGTGKFSSYDRAEPLPWVALSTQRHFGTYIGLLNGEQAIALTARQEALRIKGVKVEAVAIGVASQSDRFGFVGVGVSW